MDRDEMSTLYRGPPIDALAKWFQRRRFFKICIETTAFWIQICIFKQELSFFNRRYFRNQPIRNKNCLWWPYLLMDRDEMGNLYRGPSRDASYQISINLGKRFQRRFFQKSTNQKQEWPVVAMFTGRNEQSL